MEKSLIKKAADTLTNSKNIVAFTGAGISVASGIPPFRGKDGLWSKYEPTMFDIDFFMNNPDKSWKLIKEIFYTLIAKAKPNAAHYALAKLQCPVITQNIDGLHQEAGSLDVVEFHGTAKTLTCTQCAAKFKLNNIDLTIPGAPRCSICKAVLKPDFVFFKEPIPELALKRSMELASTCDVMLVIGTTGEIMPASQIPYLAKRNKATIIEINPNPSNFTNDITDIFIKEKAEEALPDIIKALGFELNQA